MLELSGLSVNYGQHPALQDAALNVATGEIVVILGANGAGKSTLLRAIAGVCEGQVAGSVTLDKRSLIHLTPDRIVEQGVALVPEGRGIFADLSVRENLLLGAYGARARASEKNNLQRVLQLFPKLQERQNQLARTMSGGEQQMVAIGRAMMSNPDILMLDEPSLGLSPLLCRELFASLLSVRDTGIGILLVEQNARQSLAIADRGYLLENTRIVREDSASQLANDPAVQEAYLGAGRQSSRAPGRETDADTDADTIAASAGSPRSADHRRLPASPIPAGVAQPRRTADQQLGQSIDELVAQAIEVSQSHTAYPGIPSGSLSASPNSKTGLSRTGLSGSETDQLKITGASRADLSGSLAAGGTRAGLALKAATNEPLRTVVYDIERAAREARQRHRQKPAVRPDNTTTGTSSPRSAARSRDGRPVVVEVYRRPRVDVYRRRPGGQFERD